MPPRLEQETVEISKIVSAIQDEMTLYGYQTVATPIIEPASLFLTRAGDQVITRLFTFERHGQQLALRPEFTAAAAHYYTQQSTAEIVRWQFSGPIFEDDPESTEPDYQHLSMGAELIGMAGAAADSEILSLAVRGAARLGITDSQLVIGHTGILRHVLGQFHLDSRTGRFLLNHMADLRDPARGKSWVLAEFDRAFLAANVSSVPEDVSPLEEATPQPVPDSGTREMLDAMLDATQRGVTMGGRTRHDIARRLLQKRQRLSERQHIVAALDTLERWAKVSAPPEDAFEAITVLLDSDDVTGRKLLADWREVVELLGAYSISPKAIVVQPHLTRNWDYYTGLVFELRAHEGAVICGGGRYDELVALVGGDRPVPAVGFAYYLDQILRQTASPPGNGRRTVTITPGPEAKMVAQAVLVARQLRESDIPAVILPQDSAALRGPLVRIDSAALHMGLTSYSFDQIESLLADIQQAHDET